MRYPQKQAVITALRARQALARTRLLELQQVENRFPWIRLGVLIGGALISFVAWSLLPTWAAAIVMVLALAMFIIAAVLHRRVTDEMERMIAFEDQLSTHLARAALDWQIIPAPVRIDPPAEHPFAADLNITGERSLHQLLDTTTSLGGSRLLASWLLQTTPDDAQTLERQALVSELMARPAFCTRLELSGLLAAGNTAVVNDKNNIRSRIDGDALVKWLNTHSSAGSLGPIVAVLGLLAAANIVLFALNAIGVIPAWWIATFVIYMGIQAARYRESADVFGEAYDLARRLGQLRVVLTDLEGYPFPPGSHLFERCAAICAAPQRPSLALRRIGRIVSAASLRQNPLLSLALNLLVPWDLFFAYQLERIKRELAHLLPDWLNVWYELEALAALAGYALRNPESTFPEIATASTGPIRPVFAAFEMGHPLIHEDVRVDNSFTMEELGQVSIITGSNMSGKSTFLRTVGINMVMAYAGTTVPARRLRTVPFRLFTSMTLNDSLADGISFFYAEVRRLRALLEGLEGDHALPMFFLIDEIFRGTNNRERAIGSRSYTQALAGRNGVGLISTHDLELAHLEESIPAVSNFHFREDIHDGKMVFDYTIRPGPSPTTNALRIMKLAGLPVEE